MSKFLLLPVFFISTLLLSENCNANSVPDTVELEVLEDFYTSTGGDNWTHNYGWPTDWSSVSSVNDLIGAFGLTIQNGDVTHIDMINNNLTGSLPQNLGDMSDLYYLQLNNNHLTGSIPASLGNPSNLQYILLHYNDLSGSIPSNLYNASALKSLYLNSNDLTGTLGSGISGLTSLEKLNLENNHLSGSLPAGLYQLTSLLSLKLDYNQFSGSISESIGNLSNLADLYLNDNDFSGDLPENIGNLTALKYLLVANNDFTGEIPSSIGNLTELLYLICNNNNLSGDLPQEIGDLDKLQKIYLYSNQFTGSLPSGLYQITPLISLKLDYNQFSGGISEGIGNLTNLTDLYLTDNNFSGDLPEEIGDLTSLKYLLIANNDFTGEIPSSIGNLTELLYMICNDNDFSGDLPQEIGNLNKLQRIYLNSNQFSGQLPVGIGNLEDLQMLYIYSNQFEGLLPDSIGNLSSLLQLKIQNNSLTGEIPDVLSGLTNLQIVEMENNKFVGALPASVTDLSSLVYLDITNNHFSSLPDFSQHNNPSQITLLADNNHIDQTSITQNSSAGLSSFTYTTQTFNEGAVPDALEAAFLYEFYAINEYQTAPSEVDWENVTNEDFGTWDGITVENGDIVDLFFWGVNDIPASISNLTALQRFHFLYYFGTSIPDMSAEIQLKEFILNDAKELHKFPAWLQSLHNLETIKISSEFGDSYLNNTTNQGLRGTIPLEVFLNNPNLRTFDVSCNSITQLPDLENIPYASELKIWVGANRLSVDDISRFFTGFFQSIFAEFHYSYVDPTAQLPEYKIPRSYSYTEGSNLEISVPGDTDPHAHYTWHKKIGEGYSYQIFQNITNENEPGNNGLLLTDADQADEGIYKFTITHDWLPGITFQGPLIYVHKITSSQYNGNISVIKWKGATDQNEHLYTFGYDQLNRIKSADYFDSNTSMTGWVKDNPTGSFDVANINYDLNGNLTTLTRMGDNSVVNDLTYYYSGNQLVKLDNVSGYVDSYYSNYNGPENYDLGRPRQLGEFDSEDYLYDNNGNMTQDLNKKIDHIEYNHLNLPGKIVKDTGEYIEYIYDAAGVKLSQIVYDANNNEVSRTDYDGEFIYTSEEAGDPKLELIQHEEGRIVMDPIDSTWIYQYHLKDHLGNVRTTFTSHPNTITYKDTFEPDDQDDDSELFEDAEGTLAGDFNSTSGGSNALHLWGSPEPQVGSVIAISVTKGDKINATVNAKYLDMQGSGPSPLYATLAEALVSSLTGGTTGITEYGAGTISDNFGQGSLIGTAGFPYENSNAPAAFLNLIFIPESAEIDLEKDVSFAYDQLGSGFTESPIDGDSDSPFDVLSIEDFEVPQNGYIVVYVSNEGSLKDVYFDDIDIEVEESPVIQSDDYYPFGLTFDSYQRVTSKQNDYLYQGKELQPLETYDFHARMYDPALGRTFQQDPMGELFYDHSPYSWVKNNPLLRIDPTGMTDFTFDKKTGEVTQVGKANDDPDRIVKTYTSGKRKGQVKTKKNGEARVAMGGIEKGILADGQNWKTDDQVIEVGGEGQASLAGVEDFVTRISEYVGVEIAGAYLSQEDKADATISKVYIDEYKGNKTKASSADFTKLYTESSLKGFNLITDFHTHPSNIDVSRLDVERPSGTTGSGGDLEFRDNNRSHFYNFLILTRTASYPSKVQRINYTNWKR